MIAAREKERDNIQTRQQKGKIILAQNLEIEFKNILHKEDFINLMNYFSFSEEDFFSQENFYFDTPTFSLKNLGCALRVREKEGSYELTLKQPHAEGLLETNEPISKKEVNDLFQGHPLKNEMITRIIEEQGINTADIQYFGSLKTRRAEIPYKEGLIVLDHSMYLNTEDFELEYEVNNRKKGSNSFQALLNLLEIPIRKTDNKILRFYKEKYKQMNN
ncbi:CYTH domain-containing protein [Cytobacillus purgationiresistens]|uniref:Uncharacterized protein YjbK n=1 Tax=Cytobacillus purgationiresistens TaxID=863449 RepID=A0ABU0ABT8_9BACI|nr:CYTH domain-containing protein [Cytobacillus purgationiresistens]MDQ0268719.1 uncharacterized protein YjbK [Cytobacillus purgationiresistens]